MKPTRLFAVAALAAAVLPAVADAGPLKLHAVFTSHVVLQRDKPIAIWGWADAGDPVTVKFGDESATAVAAGDQGRWEVTFPARGANAEPVTLVATTGDEKVALEDVLVGDVWVANGQSNMAWGLDKTTGSDVERLQANLPLFRHFRITPNEQSTLQTDIPAEAIENGGWEVSTPETALGFSAIGYYFGSRVQRALGIPVGVITNARGGASIESLVPGHKFADHPLAAAYKAHVDAKAAAFDGRAEALETWEKEVAKAKARNVPEAKWPPKPVGTENLRSWSIPGKSPSDAASCYNGMFGVFQGLGIKGVLFHQGYNNAMFSNCRPERYRVLTKLMVEGWREDFNDPNLPVAVIGFCAGGDTQNEDNFEALSYHGGPYIREAQRLGLADVGDAANAAFLPAYDVKVPGLHPQKKAEHGLRAARWALARVYGQKVFWETAALVSASPAGDEMALTFDNEVIPDDRDGIPQGFSVAGEDGQFYRAHARYRTTDLGKGKRNVDHHVVHVWSTLVAKPVAVRYAWSTSPVGNLKVAAHPDCPVPSFRTDARNLPVSDDLDGRAIDRGYETELKTDAADRLDRRRAEEANRAVEILARLKSLGRQAP